MHPQARDPASDLAFFVEKVRAGAHAAITQYFFVAEAYFEFVERCDKARLGVPVVPGIMPIVNGAQLLRFSEACGADVPRWIRLRLQQYADDRASLQAFGFEVVGRLCETLLAAGAPGLHFYTINQAEPSLRLWRQLRIGSAATATAL
jgi:methylenetetrahydrofolate reductase (NADPH)